MYLCWDTESVTSFASACDEMTGDLLLTAEQEGQSQVILPDSPCPLHHAILSYQRRMALHIWTLWQRPKRPACEAAFAIAGWGASGFGVLDSWMTAN